MLVLTKLLNIECPNIKELLAGLVKTFGSGLEMNRKAIWQDKADLSTGL